MMWPVPEIKENKSNSNPLLPVLEEPFRQIAIDIAAGPIVKSQSRKWQFVTRLHGIRRW